MRRLASPKMSMIDGEPPYKIREARGSPATDASSAVQDVPPLRNPRRDSPCPSVGR